MAAPLPDGFKLDPLPKGFKLDPAPTAAGAFARSAARSVVPTAGGVAAFAPGAAAGALLGALGGPFAEITVPLGALVGGTAASLGAGYAVDGAQTSLLNRLPNRFTSAIGQDQATVERDQQQFPLSSFAGGAVPQILFMRPGFVGKAPALIGAGIGAGTEAGRELATDGRLDPAKLAIAAGSGALLQRPTRLGRAIGVPSDLPTAKAARARTALPEGFTLDEAPARARCVRRRQ